VQAKHGIGVLRIGASALMLTHGWDKLVLLIDGAGGTFPDPVGIGALPSLLVAVVAELVCSLLCLVGYRTRLAALPIVATMAVAAFLVHAEDGWTKQEFPLLYGLCFLALVVGGSGAPSMDLSMRRRNLDEV
jgi:putative oxidoreductase